MEASLELEDDIFFKDLSKQISLLIMDDDDEHSFSHAPPLNLQMGFSEAMNPAVARERISFLKYNEYVEKSKRCAGTGVFIPRCSSNSRRKNHDVKQGRFMASGNKFQRPASDYNNSTGLPHNQSHDHSFKLTRF